MWSRLLGRSVAGMKQKVLVRIDRVVMRNVFKLCVREEYLVFGTPSLLLPLTSQSFLVPFLSKQFMKIIHTAISYLFKSLSTFTEVNLFISSLSLVVT